MVAYINSPCNVTISGDADAINEVDERIAAVNNGTFYRKLLVNTAYHSHHMHAVADDYCARLGVLDVDNRVADDDGEVAFFSSITGGPKTPGFSAEYWIANFVFPVRFSNTAQTLGKARYQAGQQTFLRQNRPTSCAFRASPTASPAPRYAQISLRLPRAPAAQGECGCQHIGLGWQAV